MYMYNVVCSVWNNFILPLPLSVYNFNMFIIYLYKNVNLQQVLKFMILCGFFTGDHPATDFEKGTQQGGTYPCGGCSIHVDMIDDPPHALRLPTRSLLELQTLATAGKFG